MTRRPSAAGIRRRRSGARVTTGRDASGPPRPDGRESHCRPGRFGIRSAYRQLRFDDSAIPGQKRGADHARGSNQNAICRITMKGVRQRSQFGRHRRRESVSPHQWTRNRLFQPLPQGNRQANAAQIVQHRHFPQGNIADLQRRIRIRGRNRLLLTPGQSIAVSVPPEQYMRLEQRLHRFRLSQPSSGNTGSTTSSRMTTVPSSSAWG